MHSSTNDSRISSHVQLHKETHEEQLTKKCLMRFYIGKHNISCQIAPRKIILRGAIWQLMLRFPSEECFIECRRIDFCLFVAAKVSLQIFGKVHVFLLVKLRLHLDNKSHAYSRLAISFWFHKHGKFVHVLHLLSKETTTF